MDASLLHELLGARERRFRLRCARAAQPGVAALAEVAIVIPGLPKRDPALRPVFARAVELVAALAGGPPCDQLEDEAGDYALFAVAASAMTAAPAVAPSAMTAAPAVAASASAMARALKRGACAIEEAAPWGRLLDIDCHGPDGKIAREGLGLAPRRCLLCAAAHDACIAARRHSLAEARAAALALAATLDDLDAAVEQGGKERRR